MCFGPAVSGRRCPGSTEAAIQYTEGFRNGWQLVSMKKSGARVWNSTMNWKGSAGSGKVWTAVQNLCLDAGYTGSGDAVKQRGYIPHIRPRGEEKKELECNPDFRAHIAGSLRLRTLFLIDSTNSWSVMKRKLPTTWLCFNLSTLSLSGVSSFASIANFGRGSKSSRILLSQYQEG